MGLAACINKEGKVMKWFVLLLILGLAFFAIASAEETSQANWDNSLGTFGNNLRNYTSGHSHDYALADNDRNFAYGPGLDLIFFEKDIKAPVEGNKVMKFVKKEIVPDLVKTESRVDFGNGEFTTYAVVTYNIFERYIKPKMEKADTEPAAPLEVQ